MENYPEKDRLRAEPPFDADLDPCQGKPYRSIGPSAKRQDLFFFSKKLFIPLGEMLRQKQNTAHRAFSILFNTTILLHCETNNSRMHMAGTQIAMIGFFMQRCCVCKCEVIGLNASCNYLVTQST